MWLKTIGFFTLTNLSDTQQKLFNKLSSRRDVPISVLFRALTGRWPNENETMRHQQQRLGPHITRLNAKIAAGYWRTSDGDVMMLHAGRDMEVRPGEKRNTYRLYVI